MSDGPIKLEGPDGKPLILKCQLAVEGVYQEATCRVWRENGGEDIGLTIAQESDKGIGFACSFARESLPILVIMMSRASQP